MCPMSCILQEYYTDYLKMCRSYNVTTYEVPEEDKEVTNNDTTVVPRTAPHRPR